VLCSRRSLLTWCPGPLSPGPGCKDASTGAACSGQSAGPPLTTPRKRASVPKCSPAGAQGPPPPPRRGPRRLFGLRQGRLLPAAEPWYASREGAPPPARRPSSWHIVLIFCAAPALAERLATLNALESLRVKAVDTTPRCNKPRQLFRREYASRD
jgi:hypothetical protein